ncbi:MAG: serine/threonine protein kinase [Cyanobacteria bacterium HKST-UBA01]|nr:serine/threonine protein kinase [Cyanobacteria bacterium HKST-UBA01]
MMLDKDKLASLLQDRYEIKAKLGAGGMGAVWKAYDKFLRIDVAIKVISAEAIVLEIVSRFHREAKLSSKLNHQNIITIFDFGLLEDEIPYMVLEYFEGQTLEELLSTRGSLSIEDSLSIFKQLAEGLVHAHKSGVIHRDLKPANIIIRQVDDAYEVKILDFGMAKPLNTDGIETLTKSGSIVGSPLYMSPEQTQSEEVDERTDIYSLGCVMFNCLTGSPPIVGPSALETMFLKSSQKAPTLKESGVEASASLERIVVKCLSIERQDRYPAADALLEDLKEIDANQYSEGEEGDDHEAKSLDIAEEQNTSDGSLKNVYIVVGILVLFVVSAVFLYKAFSPEEEVVIGKETFEEVLPGNESLEADDSLRFDSRNNVWMLVKGAKAKDFQEFARKQNVDSLVVNGVDGDGKLFDSLKDTKLIQIKFLGVDPIKADVLKSIGQISTLRKLFFQDSNFESTEVLSELSHFPHLNGLNLRATHVAMKPFAARDIELIGKIPKLKSLSIYGPIVEKDALRALPGDHEFQRLFLTALPLEESDLAFLPEKKVRNLGLQKMHLSPEFFFQLKSMKLDSIDIHRVLIPKTRESPWEAESVIELSRQFPSAEIVSNHGTYLDGKKIAEYKRHQE